MDQNDPFTKYRKELQRVRDSDLYQQDKEALLEFASALDEDDPSAHLYKEDGKRHTCGYNTISTYLVGCRRFASLVSYPLMDTTPDLINKDTTDLYKGIHPTSSGDGYARGTIKIWQTALRMFYRYHDEVLDYTKIMRFTTDETHVDERDMFTREEVQAMRRAATHPRDRALLELFLNTGQRLRVLQTLRVKDIDLDGNGVYFLNTEAGGLKGADKRGLKRPLLGAKPSVADWMEVHPKADDPEAYFLTAKHAVPGAEPGDMLSRSSITRVLKEVGSAAGVKKPLNPHNFRHYFVTAAKKYYHLDDSTIKFLIGHATGSRVMETTYSHLSSDDHIKNAEVDMGLRDPGEDSPLTPEVCPTCNAVLEAGDKACVKCGTLFTPDAHAAKEQVEDLSMEAMREADTDQEMDDVEDFRRFLKDNPNEAVDILREELADDEDEEGAGAAPTQR